MPIYLMYGVMVQTLIPSWVLCEGEIISPMLKKASWRMFSLLVIGHLVGIFVMPDPVFVYLWTGLTFPPIVLFVMHKAGA